MDETKQNREPSTTSQPSTELFRWVAEQWTILAEVFGESLSVPRLRLCVEAVIDLGQARLAVGFNRAARECRFWPKPVDVRELAGASVVDDRRVQAEGAWKWASDYLSDWGVDLLPEYRGGKMVQPPPIPQEIDYALRRIGGLRALNQVTEQSRPFMFRDFCESCLLAPVAESLGCLPAPRPERPALTGETENHGEPVSFTDIAKQVAAVARAKGMPAHERKLREYKLRTRHVPVIPAARMTAEEIASRRDQDRAEIERYAERIER